MWIWFEGRAELVQDAYGARLIEQGAAVLLKSKMSGYEEPEADKKPGPAAKRRGKGGKKL